MIELAVEHVGGGDPEFHLLDILLACSQPRHGVDIDRPQNDELG